MIESSGRYWASTSWRAVLRRRVVALSVVVAAAALAAFAAGCGSSDAAEEGPRHQLFQVSTIGALSRGLYDGDLAVSELPGRGDFGLGTYDRLDGEMVVVDGTVYQVRTDGVPRAADGDTTTPFAAVTDFVGDETLELDAEVDFAGLQSWLDGQLATHNVPVAIRISGVVPSLQVRSVPEQSTPYPPLSDVIAEQTVFDLDQVAGTLVGFLFPAYLSELNVSGYHFHFLSDDRSAGGHVLDGRFASLRVELQYLRDFEMWLPPAGGPFDSADLEPDMCVPAAVF